MGCCWRACGADVSLEDSGNYTCEINGPLNSLLGSVTHYVFVRGERQWSVLQARFVLVLSFSSTKPLIVCICNCSCYIHRWRLISRLWFKLTVSKFLRFKLHI